MKFVILDTGPGAVAIPFIFPPISNQPELLLHSPNASGEKKGGAPRTYYSLRNPQMPNPIQPSLNREIL